MPPFVMESVGGLVIKSQLIAPMPLTMMYKISPPRASVMIKADKRTMPKKSALLKIAPSHGIIFR
ncbi:MAG: hypothetical protein MZV70_32150 [Desulfobacterales bacterium]|nr:hypothetical protein [Desulfobacterales bacterium]